MERRSMPAADPALVVLAGVLMPLMLLCGVLDRSAPVTAAACVDAVETIHSAGIRVSDRTRMQIE